MTSWEQWVLTQEAQAIELGERAWYWLDTISIDGWTPLLELQYMTEQVGLTHRQLLDRQTQ